MNFTSEEQNFIFSIVFVSIYSVIGVYNVFLYLASEDRDRIYINYSVLLFGLALHTSNYIIRQFSASFAGDLSIISASITTYGGLLFAKSFLRINAIKHGFWHRLYTLLIALAIGVFAMQVLNMSLTMNLANVLAWAAAFTGLLSVIIQFSSGALLWRKEETAKLFVYTSIPLFIGALAYILSWFLISETDPYGLVTTIRYFFYACMTIQMILFSVVIGFRLKRLEKERIISQEQLNQRLQLEVDRKTMEIEMSRQKLENSNEIKNKLFSLVSHDLRSPLTSLLGVLMIIEKSVMSQQELSHYISDLKTRLNSSIGTLNRILTWSYSQLDGLKLSKEKLSLQQVIDENTHFFAGHLETKDLLVRNQLNGETIFADKEMIDTVVRNLLSNAIKFSHKGGTIDFEVIQTQHHILLKIIDYGVGMKPERLNKLMDTEEHFTEPGTEGEKGIGFGSIITRDFVKLNDAEVSWESEPDKGTSVTLRFKKVEVV